MYIERKNKELMRRNLVGIKNDGIKYFVYLISLKITYTAIYKKTSLWRFFVNDEEGWQLI